MAVTQRSIVHRCRLESIARAGGADIGAGPIEQLRSSVTSQQTLPVGFARRKLCAAGALYGTQTQTLFSPLTQAPVLVPALVHATGGVAGGSQSTQ